MLFVGEQVAAGLPSTDHLDDPFVPTWQVMNDDDARELAGAVGRA